MNTLFKKMLFYIFCALFILDCKTKGELKISQFNTDNPVSIRLAKSDKSVIGIKIPNTIVVTNNSDRYKSFVKIEYVYNNIPYNRDYGISLFEKVDDTLKSTSATRKKVILKKESLEYIYYTRHFVDSSKATQQHFKPYIKKMLAENKDTLHIGTVTEFKTKHKALFEKLTKGDSISIQLLDGKKLGERITVPVEW